MKDYISIYILFRYINMDDEYAFILHNKIIRSAATPAYKRAAQNAANNRKPFSMLLTTTPGDLTTEEGKAAYATKAAATPFLEEYYDFGIQKLEELKKANTNSSIFYIRYTYQQLGSGQDYFAEMVKDLEKDWVAIRREVLLEWATITANSPFKAEDLEIVKQFIHEPKRTIMLGGLYPMHIYEELSPYNPPIIGCDVSSGYYKDSSTIVVIDSSTTKTCAVLNCNYISPVAFADVIYELIVKYMPNAVLNIEKNNVGAAVLAKLKNSKIKNNIYYEIKERVLEERFDGIHTVRNKQKVKVYGLDNTKTTRDLLIDILRERMEYHKDKFISPILYHELETLEVKKNGRVEHADDSHDDTVFGYLMALYVWYYGKNIMGNWGIKKSTIRSDEDYEESLLDQESSREDNIFTDDVEITMSDDVQDQIKSVMHGFGKLSEEFLLDQSRKDQELLEQLLANNKLAREAYAKKYNDNTVLIDNGQTKIPDSVFLAFVDNEGNLMENNLNRRFVSMGDQR